MIHMRHIPKLGCHSAAFNTSVELVRSRTSVNECSPYERVCVRERARESAHARERARERQRASERERGEGE
jgi:hypothetical protein